MLAFTGHVLVVATVEVIAVNNSVMIVVLAAALQNVYLITIVKL